MSNPSGDSTISGLPAAAALTGSEVTVIDQVQNGTLVTVKVAISQIIAQGIIAAISGGSAGQMLVFQGSNTAGWSNAATIVGATIDNTPIGGSTPNTGSFTGITVSGTASINTLSLTNGLGVGSGGTGRTTLTNHGVLLGQGANAINQTSAGTSGQMLLSAGASADPAFGNNPTITGGTIDNAVIGGTTPVAGTFTTLKGTGGTIDGNTIGGTTPANGTFLVLRGNSLVKIIVDSPTQQSIPNNTLTTITNWTSRLDTGGNFAASTGTFTAPRAGRYQISAQYQLVSANYSANNEVSVVLTRNGTQTRTSRFVVGALTGAIVNSPCLAALMDLAANDTVTVQAFQNSGSAINTANANSANIFLTIAELP